MNKYKCIVWDWNGTLMDDRETCVKAMNTLLKRRNLPELTLERYLEIFDFPVRNYYNALAFPDSDSYEDLSQEFVEAYDAHLATTPLQKDAIWTLEKIKSKGMRQVALSASMQKRLEDHLKLYRVDHYFSPILGIADIYGHGKADIARQWLAKSGYKPSEILLVGDTAHDAEVAGVMGCHCLLVAQGHQSKARLEMSGAEVVDSLKEVIRHIEG
jgi:phosphoglycolate phosphatase